MSTITAETLFSAMEATEFLRSQIQGFYYSADEAEAAIHVIRDLTLPPGEQAVWECYEAHGVTYDEAHPAMMREIEILRYRVALAALEEAK